MDVLEINFIQKNEQIVKSG